MSKIVEPIYRLIELTGLGPIGIVMLFALLPIGFVIYIHRFHYFNWKKSKEAGEDMEYLILYIVGFIACGIATIVLAIT